MLGPNGAGKTSLLEVIHLLGRGRSFRPGRVSQLTGPGGEAFEVQGVVAADGRARSLGLRQGSRERVCRVDGRAVESLAELTAVLPVLVFEPHAHELVEGGPEQRRRYLDWGAFHVEQGFLAAWRRYRRALRQRNAALRQRNGEAAAAWEPEMARAGEALSAMRGRYGERLAASLPAVAAEVAPGLEGLTVSYRPGWAGGQPLARAVAEGRAQDLRLGFSGQGPHRDDLRLELAGRTAARRLSRGQEKLVALAMVVAQARLYAADTGRAPVLLLDDLPSELDAQHLARCVEVLSTLECQAFVTSVDEPAALAQWRGPRRWFHVEQGTLARVV